jgi:hypothetical protein
MLTLWYVFSFNTEINIVNATFVPAALPSYAFSCFILNWNCIWQLDLVIRYDEVTYFHLV